MYKRISIEFNVEGNILTIVNATVGICFRKVVDPLRKQGYTNWLLAFRVAVEILIEGGKPGGEFRSLPASLKCITSGKKNRVQYPKDPLKREAKPAPPEEYSCCREDYTPHGSRQPSRWARQRR